MSPYRKFSIGEFVVDDFFLESCLNPTVSTEQFWSEWQRKNPDRQDVLQEAQAIVKTLADGKRNYALVRLPKEKVEALWQRINATVTVGNDLIEEEPEPKTKSLWLWGVAATVALLAFFGAYAWLDGKAQQPLAATNLREFVDLATTSFLQIKNEQTTAQTYTLSDSSKVALEPGSVLLYPADFGKLERTVHLRGDAEFDISHQPDRPFIVYADQLVARVLGTRFKVFRLGSQTEVSVLSGKVSVSKRKNFDKKKLDNAVVLLPNQHASYDVRKGDLMKSIVEAPIVLHQPEQSDELVFEETPISRVFSQLEKTYGISIVYDEAVFKNCTLNATLTDTPFKVQLGLICETIHASYEIVDGQVVVSGSGCN